VRSLFLSSVLGIAALCLPATWPSQARAWHGGWGRAHGGWGSVRGGWRGWQRGWWGGRSGYWGPAALYPYPGLYYPLYGLYYPPYGYYPSANYSAQTSLDWLADSGFGGSGGPQAELPHPTGGAAVAPPDAGLIRLRLPDKFAEVSFNGQSISSVGRTRAYVTPQLLAGQTYRYLIVATWGQEGQQTTKEQTVEVARGQISAVDFTAAPDGSAKH
jgi:uncharacterized protein (TIGR03000 family)